MSKSEFLREVSIEEAFWTCNGVISKNIYELLSNIRSLSRYGFAYHVNSDMKKNDFADWLCDVLGDEGLAEELRGVYDKQKYVDIIQKRIWLLGSEEGSSSGKSSKSFDDLMIVREKFLSDVPFPKTFWSCNKVYSMNIYELLNNIKALDDKRFLYHVNKVHNKNDFAVWIRDALGDEELALRLGGVSDKGRYADIIQQRIEFFENLEKHIDEF